MILMMMMMMMMNTFYYSVRDVHGSLDLLKRTIVRHSFTYGGNVQ